MLTQDKENKLIELFFHLDEFCIALEQWKTQTNRLVVTTRKPTLSDSELMSICVFYPGGEPHYSGYKCFQYYYQHRVQFKLSQGISKFRRKLSY